MGRSQSAWKTTLYGPTKPAKGIPSKALAAYHRRRATKYKATRECPNRCEVCGNTCKTRLHLDHDHKTELFRGWLCGRCNRVLGYVYDDVALLKKLIVYLGGSV